MSPSLSTPFIHHSSTLSHGTNPFPFPHATSTPKPRCFKPFSVKCSLNNIPKQFRQENLKDGLMDNFKNVPQFLYGLSPSQMNVFTSADTTMQKVSEESITSAKSYLHNSAMDTMSSIVNNRSSRTSMSFHMRRGGGGRGRARRSPPDLPSYLMSTRVCYLGMPIVPAVAELIVSQLMWLDWEDIKKPVYLYINSPGTQNLNRETLGSETDAFAIADMVNYIKAPVYTVNLGMALGQAAMLLSLGKKGYRASLPHAFARVYLPKVHRVSGSVTDMCIKAKEVKVSSDSYIELLARGTGKPKEEIAKDVLWPRFFGPQDAIDYGLMDRIVYKEVAGYGEREYDEMRAKRLLQRGGGNPEAAPSGF